MLNVGDHVIYVDSTAHHRHALVTAIHGCRSIEDRVEQEKKFQASEMVQADKAGYYTPEVLARRLEAAQTAPLLMPSINVVVVASEKSPLSAVTLSEVLATSDVPGGVVNVLTGSAAEIAPWLASHADVNALDLAGAENLDWVDLQIAAAETLKRVLPPENGSPARSLPRITFFTETKTVWHTKALI